MYVEKCLNNGTEYLRLVKSQRILNSSGKKTVRKKVIFNIKGYINSSYIKFRR